MREERAAGGQRLDHGSARGGPVAAWARGGHGDGRGVAPVGFLCATVKRERGWPGDPPVRNLNIPPFSFPDFKNSRF